MLAADTMAPQLQIFWGVWGGLDIYHFVTQIQVLRTLLVALMAGSKGGRQQARQLQLLPRQLPEGSQQQP